MDTLLTEIMVLRTAGIDPKAKEETQLLLTGYHDLISPKFHQ